MKALHYRNKAMLGGGALLLGLVTILPAGTAGAAVVLGGPLDLGTAESYGVLAASAITNTGPTTVVGDIGVSPGSAISGFTGAPDGMNTGAVNSDNPAALQAQSDVTTAFNAAAGLTPTTSGLEELAGLSLTPGVYAGGALSLSNNGSLTLAGDSNAVWVFQAASSLTIGSGTHIIITGGATACNVFWQVGSSATLGTTAEFQGTILAQQSITANTGATVTGRLLASTAAVTLQSNVITVPPGCAPGTTPTSTDSPAFTSGSPTAATVDTPYSFTISASGTPAPTFDITDGSLPDGLDLDSVTGAVSGTPTTVGTSRFTVTAENGLTPDVSAIHSITVAATGANPSTPGIAATGANAAYLIAGGAALVAAGVLLLILYRARSAVAAR